MKMKIVLSIRILLAMTFFWVIADRMSILGTVETPGVVWGNFESFLNYTAQLNYWMPRILSDILGYVVTLVEFILAVGFLIGKRLKEISLISIFLFITFLLSISFAFGFEAIDFLIFTFILMLLTLFVYIDTKKKN